MVHTDHMVYTIYLAFDFEIRELDEYYVLYLKL